MAVTDAQIREYRDALFGRAFDYDRHRVCQIALGNRESHKGLGKERAKAMVDGWIAERKARERK